VTALIEVSSFAGRPVAVMGLGRSGLATARALLAGGAQPWAWDDSAERRAEAAAAGVPLVDLHRRDLSSAAALVLSPGIPLDYPAPHPVARRAREAGLEIVGDIELLARSQPNAAYVGVTGTNGKSTTTALIGHILGLAHHRVQVGGNLGTPALALAPLGAGGIKVLELSSKHLQLVRTLALDFSVLNNKTPHHLDRHGGMAGYVAAKRRIFERARAAATAVVGMDDAPSRAIRDELAARHDWNTVPISAERRLERGVYVLEGMLHDGTGEDAAPIADLRPIPTLPGRHNWQNAAAAYAAARATGVGPAVIAACLRSFPGLPHRQELVAVIDGVRYVNDSKATNADAAEKAILCYESILWIAGGRPKEGGIEPLRPHFHRIRHAYLIGEAAEAFAATLAGAVPATICVTLESAVAAAAAEAARQEPQGAVVLLSPACASFDQFTDFEARGDAFRHLVEALPGEREPEFLLEELE
jgi:UDP-N-acetylmuramoylalanine--D-glutamate ligase